MNRPVTRAPAQNHARGENDRSVGASGAVLTSRFAACAAFAANAVAAAWLGGAITYDQLDRRSNQVARRLRSLGVKPGDTVCLLCTRSHESLIAILAILKIGGAYAPLDPAYPRELLDWMIGDCAAVMAISANHLATNIPVHRLHELIDQSAAEDDKSIGHACAPEDIAYVMYTSGSTGRPKGVLVPHRAIIRLVCGQTYLAFGPEETFLHAAPLAFDASTLEIWGALLNGGRIAIVTEHKPSLAQIGEVVRELSVTTAWFTSGLFNLFVEHNIAALAPLRQIIAGGDVLSPTHVARAQAALPDCQFVNGYGPTENTTFTCCFRLPADGWNAGAIPIGYPIQQTYVRLFDDRLNEVSAGEVGELYVGGEGLALGYTGGGAQANFIPDPGQPGAILYRTGDLARVRPDGALDFLGRADRQIKIDGKRVELAEIEEALRCPEVADVVVVVANNATGSTALCAYVKPASAACDAAAAARAAALTRLPGHMRPSRFVVVKHFPLTANGKVDQHALASAPRPPTPMPDDRGGNLEISLARIFSTVLGEADIGAETNFFDLGATSLKLLAAHALIEQTHGSLDFIALFEHTTIRALAAHMQALLAQSDELRT